MLDNVTGFGFDKAMGIQKFMFMIKNNFENTGWT